MSTVEVDTPAVLADDDVGGGMTISIPTSATVQRVVDGGLLICLAALAALIATGLHGPLRVVLAFVFAMLAPGWVATGYLGSLSLYSRVIVSIGVSVGICTAVTSISLWLKFWHPMLVFIILGTLVGLALLWRLRFSPVRVEDREQRDVGAELRVAADPRQWSRPIARLAHSVSFVDGLFPLALLLWGIGVATTDLSKAQGTNGLIPALPWTFWAGIGVLLLLVAIQIHKSILSNVRLGVFAAAFVVMLQAPIALLYSGPRYFWDFKTVGEVQYDDLHGALNGNLDIYQHWPGFFGLMAWFNHVAGISNALSYLTWSPLFFDLLAVAAFGFAISALPMTSREKWLAVFIFYSGDWVFGSAQDIFTPQALGFPMFFVVVGIALRGYLVTPAPVEFEHVRRRWAAFRPLGFIWRGEEGGTLESDRSIGAWRFSDWKPLALILLVFVPLVFTHPLSPYVVVLELGALTLVNRIRPLWLPVLLGLVALAYLVPNLGYLTSRHESITGPGGIVQNVAPPVNPVGHLGLNHIAIPAITIVVYGLGAIGAFKRYRTHRDVRILAILSVTPLLLVGLVHYGAETLYRCLLFSVPWVGCLAASAFRPQEVVGQGTGVTRKIGFWIGASFAVLAILAVLSIMVENSQDELYQVNPGDIAAATWLNEQPPGVAIYLNGEFPERVGSRYDKFLTSTFNDVYLGPYAYEGASIQQISRFACGLTWGDETRSYIILSDDEASFAIHEGYANPGFLRSLQSRFDRSAYWKLAFKNSTSSIYRGPADCRTIHVP